MTDITNIVVTKNPNPKKWEEFVHNHPLGNIFQTPLTFELYKTTPNSSATVIALEDKQGNILGILVYTMIKESGIISYFSKRVIIYGGPLVIDNNIEYTKLLLSSYLKEVSKTLIIYSEVRNIFDLKSIHEAFVAEKFSYEDHLTIYIDLTQPLQVLEDKVHRKRLSNIKRSIKKNVITKTLSTEEDVRKVYKLINETYIKIKLPSPSLDLFLNAFKIMKENIQFFGAFIGDRMIACRVSFVYKDLLYDWYAGSDNEYSNLCPNDLLPWNTVQWAKENGYKIYDMGGAGKPGKEYGVRDFKLKFGGDLMNFGRYQYIHRPLFYRFGIIGLKLYKYLKRK